MGLKQQHHAFIVVEGLALEMTRTKSEGQDTYLCRVRSVLYYQARPCDFKLRTYTAKRARPIDWLTAVKLGESGNESKLSCLGFEPITPYVVVDHELIGLGLVTTRSHQVTIPGSQRRSGAGSPRAYLPSSPISMWSTVAKVHYL